ncbi:hypothetical protein JTE90_021865 [Oedothorax gibbosus]|uniref:SH3 domain-containing protein n=1 Tax=Oedothorax gibbosus TaxID=931172 RepID=A0AAV6V077_9ARAC|nr:hypothetical protein JTE90_021865 [Oedothorax gibbosus]
MRKLSLNWFRSLSYNPPDPSPQPAEQSSNQLADYTRMRHYSTIPEDRRSEATKTANNVYWVTTSHIATPDSDELTINTGDQLLLVTTTEKRPMYSLVRRISDDAQGWVPTTCLRPSSVSSASYPNIADSVQSGLTKLYFDKSYSFAAI